MFNPKERAELTNILDLSQKNLKNVMSIYLKAKYSNIVETNDYIVAIGDIPIALVAHLDTVFEFNTHNRNIELYYDTEANVMFSPDGAGFDDRAGVYAIIRILRSGKRPTIILTTDEESGGKGASALIADMPQPFFPLNYIIELDRMGEDDCVFYDCDNPKFTKYISQFGFYKEYGTFSDISIICPKWGIAGVNLSIGYYNEHTYGEILHVNYFLTTIEKVIRLLEDKSEKYKYYKKIRKFYTCGSCGRNLPESLIISVEEGKYYCYNCLSKVDWCESCGKPFEIETENQTFCKDCQKENH